MLAVAYGIDLLNQPATRQMSTKFTAKPEIVEQMFLTTGMIFHEDFNPLSQLIHPM